MWRGRGADVAVKLCCAVEAAGCRAVNTVVFNGCLYCFAVTGVYTKLVNWKQQQFVWLLSWALSFCKQLINLKVDRS